MPLVRAFVSPAARVSRLRSETKQPIQDLRCFIVRGNERVYPGTPAQVAMVRELPLPEADPCDPAAGHGGEDGSGDQEPDSDPIPHFKEAGWSEIRLPALRERIADLAQLLAIGMGPAFHHRLHAGIASGQNVVAERFQFMETIGLGLVAAVQRVEG